VRIANSKYRETKKAKNNAEALQMFLENDIEPNAVPFVSMSQEFRTMDIYQLDVNEVFKVNLNNINLLFKNYFKPRAAYLSLADAISIFTKECGTPLVTEKEA